jgi:hypothetical protein
VRDNCIFCVITISQNIMEKDIHNIKIVLALMVKQRSEMLNDVDLMLFKSALEQLGITI